MVWKAIKNLSDLNNLERIERNKIITAQKNIKLIRGTRKNVKKGHSSIRINLNY